MLGNYIRVRKALEACDFSVEELIANGVLARRARAVETGARGKIMDVVYTLTPSCEFVAEVKAANKRCEKLSTVNK